MYPSQPPEILQQLRHGKYDSSSSNGSGNGNTEILDEAGTLFNFDEENYGFEADQDVIRVVAAEFSDRDKRTSSFDGSVESSSDAFTWTNSFSDRPANPSTRNSMDSKWTSPGYALGNHGLGSLRSPPVNHLARTHTSDFVGNDYSSRPQISPSFTGYGAPNGRAGVNVSPRISPFPRTSVDIGRYGVIGTNGRSSAIGDSGFKLPPSIENHHHSKLLGNDLAHDNSPIGISPHIQIAKDSTASPLFLPNSDSKNIWGAPDMSIGVSLFKVPKETTKSAQFDASRLVPSELLRRNPSFENSGNYAAGYGRVKASTVSSAQLTAATFNSRTSQNTFGGNGLSGGKKLNPLVSPFAFQDYNQQQLPQYPTDYNLMSPSFNLRQQQQSEFHNTADPNNLYKPPSVPVSNNTTNSTYRTSTDYSQQPSPTRSASALGTYSPMDSPAFRGGFDYGSAAATDLRIVKEIQTSKLRVDESKLTTEYFDQLTRESAGLCELICPQPDERMRQNIALGTVVDIVQRSFPDATLHHFGSTALGFSLSNADMDLSISLNDQYQKLSIPQLVEKLGAVMKNAGMRDVKMLSRARVPIVKIRDPITFVLRLPDSSLFKTRLKYRGIRCEIGFQSNLVLYNTRLLNAYSKIDIRFRELVFVVKYWSKQRNINEPHFGTLSSYCFVLMVIHFLQIRGVLPCLQKIAPDGTLVSNGNDVTVKLVEDYNVHFYEDVNALVSDGLWTCANTESVGELLVAFFKYYSAEFPYVHGIASVRIGGVLSKDDKGWTKDKQQELNRSGAVKDRFWLCVEDPFEISNNVGRPVDKETLFEVRGEFIRASKILCAGAIDENTLTKVCEKAPIIISKKGTAGGMTSRKW
ncbi:UNVERIFIED_CONTAM: hypothetical protein HDU68_006050 [Siphonaria sp. JEL0065]|nr:hypothetical protein HDU68_006050 [Siphonaria sp. JEL0065]